MRKNKWIVMLLALILVFALVTSCTKKEEEPEVTPEPTATADTGTVTEPGTTEPDTETPTDVDEPGTPELVIIPRPAGVVYSLATDSHFQLSDVGAAGTVESVFGDSPYIVEAGTPRCTVIEGPDGTKAIRIDRRDNNWFGIDLVTDAFDWDLANNEYLLTVRGSILGAGTAALGGGDSPYGTFASAELEADEEFTLTLLLNEASVEALGERRQLRIHVHQDGVNFTVTEITIVLQMPRPEGVLYSMSTDALIQSLEVGATGHEIVFATSSLSNAGEPRYVIIEGPYGNAINIRNRDADWNAVDLCSDALDWDFANHTYTITVIGNVGQGTEFVMGGADSPWARFATEAADSDGNFTAVHVVASEADLEAAGERTWFRFMENGIEHYEIHDIIVAVR